MLSKKERTMALVAGSAVLIYALDSVAVTPFFTRRAELEADADKRRGDLDKFSRLFTNGKRLRKKWSESAAQTITQSAPAAESQLLHAVRDWASEARLSLSSLKPEKSEETKQFGRITFRASGTGGMRAISEFLVRLETATIPVRITDLQISSRKEGADDLMLQVGFSTIHQLASAPAPASGATTQAGPAPPAAPAAAKGGGL